jgi:ubiquinone/menaquinone biosynthesis C-methylase UbiE
MTDYNTIAKEYVEGQDTRLNRPYVYEHTFFEATGDLTGKTILDLACGDGRMSRMAIQRGASQVVGVDLSSEMIKIARAKERKNPLGIKYKIGRVGDLKKVGEFDQVWGTFLLHYSQTKKELEAMCRDVSTNLKYGGRFVALNQNPLCPFTTHKEYGTTLFPEGPLVEGQRIRVTLWNGEKEGPTFHNYHWNISTYNAALEKADLKNIFWTPLEVSPEGIEKFGESFWKGLHQYPTVNIIEATK